MCEYLCVCLYVCVNLQAVMRHPVQLLGLELGPLQELQTHLVTEPSFQYSPLRMPPSRCIINHNWNIIPVLSNSSH